MILYAKMMAVVVVVAAMLKTTATVSHWLSNCRGKADCTNTLPLPPPPPAQTETYPFSVCISQSYQRLSSELIDSL